MTKKYVEQNDSIGELIRRTENQYIQGNVTISEYVVFDMYATINKIEAYLNSVHVTGKFDSLNREKPFFNIGIAASNIWWRATDLDRRNIKIAPRSTGDVVDAFLATVYLQNWMTKQQFGLFLNDWGRVLARYGSAVIKFIEKDGELIIMIVPWNRLISDAIDFDSNIKIEILELTEAQLRKNKAYDQDVVDSLCDALQARKTLRGRNKDNRNEYIKLYEVHGEMPLSYITGKEKDEDTYVQQMQVISYVATKGKRGEFDDFVLYAGKEAKDPYMITHLIKEDGRSLAIGAIEHLFEPQWMLNHTAKAIKDQLDIASKIIFQTADGSFISQNVLSNLEHGDILIHAVNQPLTQLDNKSHDVTSLQSFGEQWKALAIEIVGISESMLGQTAPSGTAWRQVETLLNESHSLFELMTENKGLYLETMIRERILPYIKKSMDHSDEISATLNEYEITQIDSKYIRSESVKRTNRTIVKRLIKGILTTPDQQNMLTQDNAQNLQDSLGEQGTTRFFKPKDIKNQTWKKQFKDLEWNIKVDVTGENSTDKDDMATLTTVLQTIAQNPAVLTDPNAKMIFNKILSMTGAVSPLELSQIKPAPVASPIAPTASGGSNVAKQINQPTAK